MDRLKIPPDAEVSGASYLTGSRTIIGPGAVVRDSRVHNGIIEAGAVVVDSIFVAEGQPGTHKCDTAGRTSVSGAARPQIATGACVTGCTFINSSVGRHTRIADTWASNSQFGCDNLVVHAKFNLVNTGARATITGPTEVSEAYLGDHTTIDRRGYFEGIFSNAFMQLKYNESTGRLEVRGTIYLPHVSRYGTNTIVSTNSGRLLPQPNGILKGFGAHRGPWHDPLLSHEQVELGPCCWVVPYTKVIGQSPTTHHTDEELANDRMTTYVMPFGMAGVDGDQTRGLVMPGELSTGLGPKQRRGAWVFTYAPDAVIKMVRRLYEALEPSRKQVADTIVVEALRTAIGMVEAMAADYKVDLKSPADRKRKGWPRWITTTHDLLRTHLECDLWKFEGGRPIHWRLESGRWTHPQIDRLLVIAPDALKKQVSEAYLFTCENPVSKTSTAVPIGAVDGSGGDPEIDPTARVAPGAWIGRGCRIGSGSIIEAGATVWNSVLRDCRVGANARVERSILTNSQLGPDTTVRSCRVTDSKLGKGSIADAATLAHTQLAPAATVSAFGDLVNVKTEYGVILGGTIHSTKIGTYLMSMHMAGSCSHLEASPTTVELDGRTIPVPAVPMLGAGVLIRGTASAPVQMECCFIGSNAIIESGSYVGFGCFVLGTLGPNAGLPPFTLSNGADPTGHQIGGVLGLLSSTVITHFISWTFQAVGLQDAAAVAAMTRQAIGHGIDVIRWELNRRRGQTDSVEDIYAQYRSLSDYSEKQLLAGLSNYQRAIDRGAWEIAHEKKQLWFSSGKGHWLERNGVAFWKNP